MKMQIENNNDFESRIILRRKNNLEKYGVLNAANAEHVVEEKRIRRLNNLNNNRVYEKQINKGNLQEQWNQFRSLAALSRYFELSTGQVDRWLQYFEIDRFEPIYTKDEIEFALIENELIGKTAEALNINSDKLKKLMQLYDLELSELVDKKKALYKNLKQDIPSKEELISVVQKHVTKRNLVLYETDSRFTINKVTRLLEHYGLKWFDCVSEERWNEVTGRRKRDAWKNDPTMYERQIETKRQNGTLYVSNFEREVLDFVKQFISEEDIVVQDTALLDKFHLDIYLPKQRIAIECNGTYWHSSERKEKSYHLRKSKECTKKGVRLIHIYHWEWKDERIRPILESVLRNALGVTDNRIYAKKCIVQEIDNKLYRDFCELNHLQGYRPAKVKLGLYHENELVQIMSFGERIHTFGKRDIENGWEIVRGCPGSNNLVVGGVSKLFNYFVKNYKPRKVISFGDYNKFNGIGYEKLGMIQTKEVAVNSWYINKTSGKVSSWLFRDKKKRDELLENSLIVYGAGNLFYEWNNPKNIKESENEL